MSAWNSLFSRNPARLAERHVTTMSNPSESPNDAWETCSPGQLQRLVRGTLLLRRARTIRRTVLTGGAAAIVAIVAWMTVSLLWPAREPAKQGPYIAGVCCEDVRREIPDLVAMRVEPKRAAQLHQHIALCPDCRQLMQQMENKRPMSFNQPHHHDGKCPHCNSASQLALADGPSTYIQSLRR